jgi:hypothetical protein
MPAQKSNLENADKSEDIPSPSSSLTLKDYWKTLKGILGSRNGFRDFLNFLMGKRKSH